MAFVWIGHGALTNINGDNLSSIYGVWLKYDLKVNSLVQVQVHYLCV